MGSVDKPNNLLSVMDDLKLLVTLAHWVIHNHNILAFSELFVAGFMDPI